ncbi:MAG: iron-containing redox enzyme family protein [Planctomycetota bacterium]
MSTLLDAPTSNWLAALEAEVLAHPALDHPLLTRLGAGAAPEAWAAFGRQHHALVGCFTTYMELLLVNAPDSTQKLWLAKVLVDEYGEGSHGKDHAVLYREWLARVGVGELEHTPLAAEVWDFVGTHLALVRDEAFVVGLGALGPGHEWAIPSLFARIIPGLEASGFSAEQRLYFDLHTEQDVEHGAWMRQALEQLASDERMRDEVRRGALTSLAARAHVWDAALARIDTPEASFVSPGTLRELRAAVGWFVRGRAWPTRHDR